jgi:peptidoglycan hydrolase-like protein with peptidoglycan-binding domain
MVLQAQQWVNATYASVSGVTKVTENGKTGWSTMYSLTRALQYELGLASLSNTFGPGTLGLLQSRGGIKWNESNKNIVTILQCACYCKGYSAGNLNGAIGDQTIEALSQMARNAGLLPGTVTGSTGVKLDSLSPKLTKALLSMDAYTLVSGGTVVTRSVQQWLNHTYLQRTNFYVIPCDGVFSRDIQKALYLAIQFALGFSDTDATGTFGPGTRAGLKANELTQGSSGTFVSIFTAAMIFNQVRVIPPSGKDFPFVTFTDNYTSEVTTAVKAFQKFSELPVTGNADYATWCQLLASTGDPERRGTACDSVTAITDARAVALKAAGYSVVGRYLENVVGGTLNKEIQPGELAVIFRNGLKVFPIMQYGGRAITDFSWSSGWDHGVAAHNAAVDFGFNPGTVIYFAVDYDATQAEIDSAIVPYMNGVSGALTHMGKRFLHGVYGSRNVCTEVTNRTYARWSFVSGMSTGFSGNMGFAMPDNWSFNQIQTTTVGSGTGAIEIDKNIHRGGADAASASVNDPGTSMVELVAYVRAIYQLAKDFGGSTDPSMLTLQYLRHLEYNTIKWYGVFEYWANEDFIAYVKQRNSATITRYDDPVYGVSVKLSHVAVACEAALYMGAAKDQETNRGDIAGWGGDWLMFYGEWRAAIEKYSSGYTYCRDKLAKVTFEDTNGAFKLRDMIEDADAYIFADQLRAGQNIADIFEKHYLGGGCATRFHRFFQIRFHNAADAKSVAKDMLLSLNDPTEIYNDAVITLMKQAIIKLGGPTVSFPDFISPGDLDDFCRGFADVLVDLVENEAVTVSKMRAQGRLS